MGTIRAFFFTGLHNNGGRKRVDFVFLGFQEKKDPIFQTELRVLLTKISCRDFRNEVAESVGVGGINRRMNRWGRESLCYRPIFQCCIGIDICNYVYI